MFVQNWCKKTDSVKALQEKNLGGGPRFTLAPAEYQQCWKGQERQIHKNANWATLREGQNCIWKKYSHIQRISSIQAFKATTKSVIVAPWLLKRVIYRYTQAKLEKAIEWTSQSVAPFPEKHSFIQPRFPIFTIINIHSGSWRSLLEKCTIFQDSVSFTK